jgi:hypothetical protein
MLQSTELVRALRKQVVVVVTAGWNIMCFDHNLKLMWETSIREDFPHHAEIKEVAIHISNHTMTQVRCAVIDRDTTALLVVEHMLPSWLYGCPCQSAEESTRGVLWAGGMSCTSGGSRYCGGGRWRRAGRHRES